MIEARKGASIYTFMPAGISEQGIEKVEDKIASRFVDILVEKSVSICATVYD